MSLTQSDLNNVAATVAGTIQGMQPPGGPAGQAYDPSTGTGYVKPGPQDQFWYPVTVAAIAPAATQNQVIAISADADFYCNCLTYAAYNHAALTDITESTYILPLVTCLITDTGSSRQLMNAPIPLSALAGSGERPFRLIKGRLFQRTTSINLSFTNFDTALTYDIYFVLGGFKVYGNQ